MIAIQSICLLIVPVSSYRFLPQQEIFPYSNTGKGVQLKYTANILDVPYHVLIIYSNLFCSGSLINSVTVITAASCFTKRIDHEVIIKTSTNISDRGDIYLADTIKHHEYFEHLSRTDNDIALVLLKKHVTFSSKVKKVILIEPETVLRLNAAIRVSGWSTSKLTPKFGNVLLWSKMTVVNKNECIKTFGHLITPSNFCAKFNPGRQLFDNGGPAVFQDLLVGIVSFGANSKQEPYLAVFTNVSYFYRWIMLNTKRFLKKRCYENKDNNFVSYSYEYGE